MSGSHPPIKRHSCLQPFSRDHYVGLVQAQHLLKAAEAGAAERRGAIAEFCDAWSNEIAAHFDDEERLLLGLISAPHAQRLSADHAIIRDLATQARRRRREIDPGVDWVRRLGQMLNDHIRWEERELYPAIEQTSTAAQLSSLEDQTKTFEANRPRSKGRKTSKV